MQRITMDIGQATGDKICTDGRTRKATGKVPPEIVQGATCSVQLRSGDTRWQEQIEV